MNRQPHSLTREIIVADAIRDVVSELRMVAPTDYVAFIHTEQFANIADIVDSAAELFFVPGTLRLGHGGEVHLDWNRAPEIVLDLELKPSGATVYFKLSMADQHAAVDVNYVAFENPSQDPDENSSFLESAIQAARIRKSEPARLTSTG